MKNLFGHEIGSGRVPLIGAALVGLKDGSELVSVDENGELWKLAPRGRGGIDRKTLIRFCLDRGMLVYASVGDLCDAMRAGSCAGLLSQLAPTVAQRWRI